MSSWWGVSAKRHKLDSGVNGIHAAGKGYSMLCGNDNSNSQYGNMKYQQRRNQLSSDWYVLKSTQGRQGYWHRNIKKPNPRIASTMTQNNGYGMESLSLTKQITIKPEIGLPFRFGKKWRPRGYFPKFSSCHGPFLEIKDIPQEHDASEKARANRMDLSITGTNGHGSNGIKQQGEETLERLAFKILDPDILCRFGLACNQQGSSASRESDKEEIDLPRLDLTAPITMETMESEQVPSSASDFSIDFDSAVETEATVACSSRQQDVVSGPANSNKIFNAQEADRAGSDILHSSSCHEPNHKKAAHADSSQAHQRSEGVDYLIKCILLKIVLRMCGLFKDREFSRISQDTSQPSISVYPLQGRYFESHI